MFENIYVIGFVDFLPLRRLFTKLPSTILMLPNPTDNREFTKLNMTKARKIIVSENKYFTVLHIFLG